MENLQDYLFIHEMRNKNGVNHKINGKTILNICISKRSYGAVETLLSWGADVNQKSNSGDTPLICALDACNDEDLSLLTLILEAGADVNLADSQGITPLMITVINGMSSCFEKVMEYNPDINAKCSSGWTALSYAGVHNRQDLKLKLLLNH